MSITKKLLSSILSVALILSNSFILSNADEYVKRVGNQEIQNENNLLQPLYDIIFSVELFATEEKVTAVVETDTECSLRVTITLYQQKGSGWSFLAKKTFSDYNVILAGTINYNFQPGVTYKAVANFNAGGETDSMEEIFSF